MSRQELSNHSFLKNIIREYYSLKPLKEPIYIHKREIALHSLEDNKYIRHLSFPSMNKLYEYITQVKTPLHLYYSSAYYDNPGAENMEMKGWNGSDLMFDIDSDKYPGCDQILSICIGENNVYEGKIKNCPKSGENPIYYPVITSKCIERAYIDAIKLYEILREEFGFHEIEIYFSGNRGFHVKVYDQDILDLTSEERREIVSYIMLENLEYDKLFPVVRSKGKQLILTKNEYGLRRRLYKFIEIADLELEDYGNYVKVPYNESLSLFDELRVHLDPVVTMDVSRLSRFGYSLNCKSGLVVSPINIDRFERFNYKEYSPWKGGLIVRPLIDASLTIYDEKIDLKRNEALYLEATIAVYLLFKNLVKIIDVKDFGVVKCMICS